MPDFSFSPVPGSPFALDEHLDDPPAPVVSARVVRLAEGLDADASALVAGPPPAVPDGPKPTMTEDGRTAYHRRFADAGEAERWLAAFVDALQHSPKPTEAASSQSRQPIR